MHLAVCDHGLRSEEGSCIPSSTCARTSPAFIHLADARPAATDSPITFSSTAASKIQIWWYSVMDIHSLQPYHQPPLPTSTSSTRPTSVRSISSSIPAREIWNVSWDRGRVDAYGPGRSPALVGPLPSRRWKEEDHATRYGNDERPVGGARRK